jgi:NAD(P)-dependent dehydrogenase (short-subunit alcohol dehydrogenase family)
MTARFAGKVVVGTGSGRPRRLGQAVLQRFADEDAICVVSDVGSGGEGLASSADALAVVADLEARWPGADGVAGRIINIASQAAKSGFPHLTPYNASKHAMVGLTRSNAVELGPLLSM